MLLEKVPGHREEAHAVTKHAGLIPLFEGCTDVNPLSFRITPNPLGIGRVVETASR